MVESLQQPAITLGRLAGPHEHMILACFPNPMTPCIYHAERMQQRLACCGHEFAETDLRVYTRCSRTFRDQEKPMQSPQLAQTCSADPHRQEKSARQ